MAQNITKDPDYLNYELGVNAIPVYSIQKRTKIKWSENQIHPLSGEQYNTMKEREGFAQSYTILACGIWRNPSQREYLVCIDIDNKKGGDEFQSFGVVEPCMHSFKYRNNTKIFKTYLMNLR